MITPKKMDILEDVLTSTNEEGFPGLAELSNLLTRPEKHAGSAPYPADKSRRRQTSERKKKVTHYLSPEVSKGLDRNLPRIRKLIPEEDRKRISKSRLVDSSLRLLLQEFEEKGENSLLVRQFLHTKDQDGSGT